MSVVSVVDLKLSGQPAPPVCISVSFESVLTRAGLNDNREGEIYHENGRMIFFAALAI